MCYLLALWLSLTDFYYYKKVFFRSNMCVQTVWPVDLTDTWRSMGYEMSGSVAWDPAPLVTETRDTLFTFFLQAPMSSCV